MSQAKDGCACGQVIFDLSSRKAGEILTCPWCQRVYCYTDKGALELRAEKAAPQPSSHKPAAAWAAENNPTKKEEIKSVPRRSARQEAVVPFPVKKTESVRIAGGPGESRRTTKRHDFKDIPGGLTRMLVFIIAFNLAAFIALYFVLRTAWGKTIPKGAIWPLMVTLVIGHVVGFIAWSYNVYRLQMKKFLALQSGAQKKQP